MELEELNEPIKVRADFMPDGRVRPLLLKRNGQMMRIICINSRWEYRKKQQHLLYFSVCVRESNDVLQLCFRAEDHTWWLQNVMMEG